MRWTGNYLKLLTLGPELVKTLNQLIPGEPPLGSRPPAKGLDDSDPVPTARCARSSLGYHKSFEPSPVECIPPSPSRTVIRKDAYLDIPF